MSAYQKTPFKEPIKLLVSGTASYLWGSWNDNVGDTLGYVISDSGNGTISTVVFQITSGNIPVVTALSAPLITIRGTANAGGAYNTTNASVLSSVVTAQGVDTVTYAGAGTSASALDGGQVNMPQPEVAEVLVAAASIPIAMPFQNSQIDQKKAIVAVVSMPSLPTTALVTLQEALKDQDPEYSDVATVASVTGGVFTGGQITIDGMAGKFYRFNTSGVTGPAGSIIAKLGA